jgi:hypothetical protein
MLCADGVPDIRGTASESFWFSDGFTPAQLTERVAGGIRILLRFNAGNTATVNFPTARDPRPGRRDFKLIPLTIKANRDQHTLEITLPDRPLTVAEGRWSDWIEWSFPVTASYTVRAISRVFAIEVGLPPSRSARPVHPHHRAGRLLEGPRRPLRPLQNHRVDS